MQFEDPTFEYHISGKTLPEAYHKALYKLYKSESDEISLTIVVENPFEEPRISKLWIGGPRDLEQYRQEMVYGILDFEVEQGLWHYTYHQRFSKYIPKIIELLKNDQNTRRAVISIRDNEDDIDSENPACLQSIQFMIRDNKLNMYVLFRSNDAVRASFMNMFALTELQKYVADEIGIEVGTYIHRANSYHVYPESRDLLKAYCKRLEQSVVVYKNNTIYKRTNNVLTYNYQNGWDKLMEEERPEIEKMVLEQKKKAGAI